MTHLATLSPAGVGVRGHALQCTAKHIGCLVKARLNQVPGELESDGIKMSDLAPIPRAASCSFLFAASAKDPFVADLRSPRLANHDFCLSNVTNPPATAPDGKAKLGLPIGKTLPPDVQSGSTLDAAPIVA
jgi:hypothetical protein